MQGTSAAVHGADGPLGAQEVCAFKKVEVNMEVSFLALDPERVGDSLISSGERTDLGDDILSYNSGNTIDGTVMHAHLEHFLTTDV